MAADPSCPPRCCSGADRSSLLVWMALRLRWRRRFARLDSPVRAPGALTAGVLAFVIGCVGMVAGRAAGAGRRRAALPGDHAEPAEGRRSAGSRTTTASATTRPTSPATCRRTSACADATARSTRSTRPASRRWWRRSFAVAGYPRRGAAAAADLRGSASALAWHLAWLVTGRRDAAWFGWAAVTLSTTWIFHSFTVYPDGPGAVLVLTGAWALLRADARRASRASSIVPWFWHGAALALLPWLHTRFAVLAGGIGALVLLRMSRCRTPPAKAFAFLAVPAVSFIGWIAYFIAIYGTPDPSAPYGARRRWRSQFVPDGLAGLLFDQRFGLLAYAPVLLFALRRHRRDDRAAGMATPRARAPLRPRPVPRRRHPLRDVVGRAQRAGAVLRAGAAVDGDPGGGRLGGDDAARRPGSLAAGALVVTVFASAVLVFAQRRRPRVQRRARAYALWLDWLNGTVDLARALPVWWRDTRGRRSSAGSRSGSAAALAGVDWRCRHARGRGGAPRTGARRSRSPARPCMFAARGLGGGDDHLGGRAGHRPVADARRSSTRCGGSPQNRGCCRCACRRLGASAARRGAAPCCGSAGARDRPRRRRPQRPAALRDPGDPGGRVSHSVRSLRGTEGWIMIGIGRDQFAIRTGR